MAYEQAVIVVIAAVLTVVYFYYDQIAIIIKSYVIYRRIRFLKKKLVGKMGNETELIVQMIQRLDIRDERLENKLDEIAKSQSNQQIEIAEIKGDIKVLQKDVIFLKEKKTNNNFATITDRGVKLTASWKFVKSLAIGSVSAGGLYSLWLIIKQYLK